MYVEAAELSRFRDFVWCVSVLILFLDFGGVSAWSSWSASMAGPAARSIRVPGVQEFEFLVLA